jgi:hypothetical protein
MIRIDALWLLARRLQQRSLLLRRPPPLVGHHDFYRPRTPRHIHSPTPILKDKRWTVSGHSGGSLTTLHAVGVLLLLHAGAATWREINPDNFGSMIQGVADGKAGAATLC